MLLRRNAFRSFFGWDAPRTWRAVVMRWYLSERVAWQDARARAGADLVLARLERLCHARATTLVPGDPHASASLEGRRQVWLAVEAQLRLSNEDLEALRATARLKEGVFDGGE